MARMSLRWLICIMILLLVGCQPVEEDHDSIAADEVILRVENLEGYLVMNIGISGFGGSVFCAYEPLKAEQGAEDRIYLWVLCQEYYLQQESLMTGSGVSLPVALQLQEKQGQYEIIGHIVPMDGAYFGPDVRAAFPRSTWSQIMPEGDDEINQYNERVKELERSIETQARSYFGIGMP